MAIELIADYLKMTTGLDSCSVGISVVEQAVSKRMIASKAASHAEYYNTLTNSKKELDCLIDQVMVPETWFFRGPETFKYLKEYLTNKAKTENYNSIRILSIPCATGEEPYSIAMLLTECGFTPNEYVIDAIDIAQASLRLAEAGLFTENSFRELAEEKRRLYFESTKFGFSLRDSIKKLVTFSRSNIFNLEVGKEDKYDVVFCRNLLIYFDKQAQHKALNKIDSLMSDDGVLFIGHGEAGCIVNSQFEKIAKPNAFAFCKKVGKKTSGIKPKACTESSNNHVGKKKPILSISSEEKQLKAKENKVSKDVPGPIEEAIKLADEGKLDKAIEKCKKLIQSDGVSADVLCLLGVIHDAKEDRSEAVNYYKRAVHLMPTHQQSLMHLASHAERDGDKEKASEYRIKSMRSSEQST